METRSLGRHGLQVPVLCLGTMTFGIQCDEHVSFKILDRALELEIDFLDTADVYPLGGNIETVGRTEKIIGRWMRQRGNRDQILLATKCRGRMGAGANDEGLSRGHILRAVDQSLRRLGTDMIDLYQTHAFDPTTPIDETMAALDHLIKTGKVRYIGCSNYPTWRLSDALATSDRLGVTAYQSVQPRYNLLYREIETELLPLCRAQGLGVLVYNPLAGGFLSGKYSKGQVPEVGTRFTLERAAPMYKHRYWQDAQFNEVQAFTKQLQARDLDPVAVAVAWVLAQPGITSAIIGASRPEQLDATRAAIDLKVPTDIREQAEAIWFRLPRRPIAEGYR